MLKKHFKAQAAVTLLGLLALETLFARMARLGDLKLHVIETITLALAAGVVYCILLYALERSRDTPVALWLILGGALLFRLTLAPLPPSLSTDLYRYQWDGRVQNAGWNPYAIAPLDPRLEPLRDPGWTVMPVPGIPTMYPPLSELVFRYTERWADRVWPDPAGFKLPFLLADLLVVALLAGWLRSIGGRNYQLAVYAWSPLVIVEFAASGHNDALAIAAVVLALTIIRGWPGVSTVVLMAGALAKLFPITLLPLWLRLAGWPRRWRGWLAVAGATALGLVCLWPYRSAYPQVLETFIHYQRIFRNYNASLYAVLHWFTGRHAVAAGIGECIVLGLAVWVAARKVDPARAAFWVIGAILLGAPNAYSWYFTWIVPMLCFFPSPAWLLLTILQFLSYKLLINYQILGIWHFDPFFQWLTYAPFYALLLGSWLKRRSQAPQAQI